jgi:hypothetical protein
MASQPEKLHSFLLKDFPDARDQSHVALEQVLKEGVYPDAECRVNYTTGEYSVWSGPVSRSVTTQEPAKDLSDDQLSKITLNNAQLERLAELLAAKMKG